MLVYVAPEMMSMFELCALIASVRSIGPATWLMYAERARGPRGPCSHGGPPPLWPDRPRRLSAKLAP